MPFDGDPRAAYAMIEWKNHHWHAEIHRIDYDRAAAERDFEQSGFLRSGGGFAPIIHREFQRARPLCSRWHRDYEEIVAAGKRDFAETVLELLAKT